MKVKVKGIKSAKSELHGISKPDNFVYINGKAFERNKIYTVDAEFYDKNQHIFTQIKEK